MTLVLTVPQELAQQEHANHDKRTLRLHAMAKRLLSEAGIESGKLLEIGGRKHPIEKKMPEFDCTNLDLSETGPGVTVGDIQDCPHIKSNSFDAVVSIDVFEHIQRPWLAAAEITRILRPGGATFHSTLFSWRYHPCPGDYWRFTPSALETLFDGLDHRFAEFDDTERRRDIYGRGRFSLKADAFGGWRENWRVNYGGVKPSG